MGRVDPSDQLALHFSPAPYSPDAPDPAVHDFRGCGAVPPAGVSTAKPGPEGHTTYSFSMSMVFTSSMADDGVKGHQAASDLNPKSMGTDPATSLSRLRTQNSSAEPHRLIADCRMSP